MLKKEAKIADSVDACDPSHGRRFMLKAHYASIVSLVRGFLLFLQSVYQNIYMIRTMTARDIRGRYVGSFLGFFWTIIHPLTQIIMYYVVFSVILKVRLGPQYGETSFAVWLMAGILPWSLFAEVVGRSPMAVLEQANIIKKTVFPSELLPLIHLLSAVLNHLVGLLILLLLLLAGGGGISWKVLLAFPIIMTIGVFSIGISWALSALNVFLRDIGQIIGVVLQIWFFMTPIIYPIDNIPERLQGVYRLNPMLHIVEAYRLALLGKTSVDAATFVYAAASALIVFVAGGLVFKKLKPAFADVL